MTKSGKCFLGDVIKDSRGFSLKQLMNPKKVIFNDPATIVYWEDGMKTVVKCGPGDTYDCEKGFAMCVLKRLYGRNEFHAMLKKYVPQEQSDSTPSMDELSNTKKIKPFSAKKIKPFDFELIFDNHDDAERVLWELVELIKVFGFAYVSDLYDLVNVANTYENTKYGWYDLTKASIKAIRDGYTLYLPRPIKHI